MKILHELGNLDGGGVARLLFDYYKFMDHDKIKFDFVISDQIENGILEQPLKEMGCTIYKLPSLKKNMKERLKKLDNIIHHGNYDAVHTHIAARSCFILSIAKKYKVPVRIAHSHIAYENISKRRKLLNRIFLNRSKQLATDLFACGRDAGKYMWGEKAVFDGKVNIMTNAVNTKNFLYSSEIAEKYKTEMGFTDKKIVGIVGRLEKQKNHNFLLDIFDHICRKEGDKYILLIIGRGSEEETLKIKCKKLGLEKQVYFMGIRDDVNKLLNIIDVFVLPSFYEGLPVVLIEAQANGVKEIVSDTVTDETAVTDLIEFVSLKCSANVWAERIIKASQKVNIREKYADEVNAAGYDIICQSRKMQEYYLSRILLN